MSSNSTHEFPAPVGGVPREVDFAPSILFAVLYGLLLPFGIRRMINPRTRTFLLVGTIIFGTERIVSFSLRAAAAHNSGVRSNVSIETYLQTDYAGGFIGIGQDLYALLRALLVDATLGSKMRMQYELEEKLKKEKKAMKKKNKKNKKGDVEADSAMTATELQPVSAQKDVDKGSSDGISQARMDLGDEVEDHPRIRSWVRGLCVIAALAYWVSIILGIVAGADYQGAVQSGSHALLVQQLWYGSISIALLLSVSLIVGAIVACFKVPRVRKTSVMWIILSAILVCVVAIYRLDVMRFSTTSLYSTAPGSQNSNRDKALFYVFHIAPEFLVTAILSTLDVRRMFATGLLGDKRGADPKPKTEAAK